MPFLQKLRLHVKRPYWQIWLVGFVFWLVTLHWLRYPHPAVTIGWVALSAYLACYLPAFVAIARLAVHKLRLPVVVIVPVVWTGLEYARAHLLTGFTLASLAHTQYRQTVFLQMCDLGGQYTLSFSMALVSAIVGQSLSGRSALRAKVGTAVACLLVVAFALVGSLRLMQLSESGEGQLRVLLVQGSVDVVFPPPPGTAERMHQEYWQLSQIGLKTFAEVDLVVWPESVYGELLVDGTADALPPADWEGSVELFRQRLAEACQASRMHLYASASVLNAPLIVGVNRQVWTAEGPKMYNSAVFVPLAQAGRNPQSSDMASAGSLEAASLKPTGLDRGPTPPSTWATEELLAIDVYDKLHLVMFGEYIPYARYFRGLLELRPLSTLQVNTEPGREPKCFVLGPAQMVPNICFESTVPHLIRRQLLFLRAQGYRPNVLVNLTNDGWFRGSAALDLHLACSVFRAVEFRKPHLIAANTGLSAFVDSTGAIRQIGGRRRPDLILAHVTPNDRETLYLRLGDWLGLGCIGLCLLALLMIAVANMLTIGTAKFFCRRQSAAQMAGR